MRLFAVAVFLAVGMTLCAPLLARADEQPCRSVGDTVVCQRAGFDVLVHKLLDAKADAKKCVLEAESRTADAAVLKARVDAALAERDVALADVAVLRAKKPPYGYWAAAVGVGFLSGAIVTLVLSD